MAHVTRRGFLRNASVGVAALGAVSTASLLMQAQTKKASPDAATSSTASGTTPVHLPDLVGIPAGSTPFMVYVTDPASGSGSILIGEEARPFNAPGIVRALQQITA